MPRTRSREGIKCTECGSPTCVIDSRSIEGGSAIRRRRKCLKPECDHRFSTVESTSAVQGKGRPAKTWTGFEEEIRTEIEQLARRMLKMARPEEAASEGILPGLQL